MTDQVSKLEERLQKKREQLKHIQEEIRFLEAKIKDARQSTVLRAAREMKLNAAQYRQLTRAIKDGSVMRFLEERYEEDKDEKNN